MKKLSHAAFKKKLLSDPEILAAYNDLEEEYALINEMLHARKRAGLTQEKIADRMHTTTSVVSRLESLPDPNKTQHSPSLSTLKRYAKAVNCVLEIKLIPKKSRAS